jgi:hypothetical protein
MLRTAFNKVADFHMKKRGYLGFGFGLAAGCLLAHSGMSAQWAADFLSYTGMDDGASAATKAELVRVYAGLPPMGLVVAALAADAGVHTWRQRRQDRNRDQNKPPQPPAA